MLRRSDNERLDILPSMRRESNPTVISESGGSGESATRGRRLCISEAFERDRGLPQMERGDWAGVRGAVSEITLEVEAVGCELEMLSR